MLRFPFLGKKFNGPNSDVVFRRIIGGIGLFLLAMFVLNIFILRDVEKSLLVKSVADSSPKPVFTLVNDEKAMLRRSKILAEPLPEDLVVQRPDEFAITEDAGFQLPRSQMEWDYELKKSLDEAVYLDAWDHEEALGQIGKSPKEYERQLSMVDRQIKIFESRAETGEMNDAEKARLEMLYMLKSTLAVFKNHIIKKEQPPPIENLNVAH